jgi:hypothetical protein
MLFLLSEASGFFSESDLLGSCWSFGSAFSGFLEFSGNFSGVLSVLFSSGFLLFELVVEQETKL